MSDGVRALYGQRILSGIPAVPKVLCSAACQMWSSSFPGAPRTFQDLNAPGQVRLAARILATAFEAGLLLVDVLEILEIHGSEAALESFYGSFAHVFHKYVAANLNREVDFLIRGAAG